VYVDGHVAAAALVVTAAWDEVCAAAGAAVADVLRPSAATSERTAAAANAAVRLHSVVRKGTPFLLAKVGRAGLTMALRRGGGIGKKCRRARMA